jgi:hypothetical protein
MKKRQNPDPTHAFTTEREHLARRRLCTIVSEGFHSIVNKKFPTDANEKAKI